MSSSGEVVHPVALSHLRHPQRFVDLHWFNPPEWTPGVEIIPAQVSDPQAVAQAHSFLQAIGKRPIVVGS